VRRSTVEATPGRAGMSDVAQLAGVSIGTVSNVLNHPNRVSPATRERVERAMTMLKYVPNVLARSLAAGSTQLLGLVLTDLTNSLFIDIARGAEQAAESAGLSLMLANSDGRLEREVSYIETFSQSRFDGMLLALNDEEHFAAIAGATGSDVPLVMLNFRAPTSQYCSVSVDNELGGYIATKHLLDTGRRKLAFVGGPESLRPVQDRARGFRRAMREARVRPAAELMPAGINRADGYDVGLHLADLVDRGDVDAAFAVSDLLAAGIAQAADSRRIDVPGQLAIIGYDNNHAAWDSPTPISTVAQPGAEMGALGVELVSREAAADHAHEARVLEPTLVVRRSTLAER
jgi:LacI family transcriptional regulator